MNEIENIGKISVIEEIKAIDPSDKSLFYEENFNSLLQEELAKKNKKKQNNNNNKSSDNHDSHHNDHQHCNADNHYDENLDNSKNDAVITKLDNTKNRSKNNNYKAVFITLSQPKETLIPIHKNKRFLTILTKIMKKIGKSIKNISKNCF